MQYTYIEKMTPHKIINGPHCPPRYGMWHCDETDIGYLYKLIALVSKRVRIDPTRIFMQDMPNGDPRILTRLTLTKRANRRF